jgi:hypothetical protein
MDMMKKRGDLSAEYHDSLSQYPRNERLEELSP